MNVYVENGPIGHVLASLIATKSSSQLRIVNHYRAASAVVSTSPREVLGALKRYQSACLLVRGEASTDRSEQPALVQDFTPLQNTQWAAPLHVVPIEEPGTFSTVTIDRVLQLLLWMSTSENEWTRTQRLAWRVLQREHNPVINGKRVMIVDARPETRHQGFADFALLNEVEAFDSYELAWQRLDEIWALTGSAPVDILLASATMPHEGLDADNTLPLGSPFDTSSGFIERSCKMGVRYLVLAENESPATEDDSLERIERLSSTTILRTRCDVALSPGTRRKLFAQAVRRVMSADSRLRRTSKMPEQLGQIFPETGKKRSH